MALTTTAGEIALKTNPIVLETKNSLPYGISNLLININKN